MMTALTHPVSRGRLWLRSDDPFAAPHIDPGYVTQRADLDLLIAGMRAALEIGTRYPLAKYISARTLPGAAEPTDAELAEHARQYGQTEYHPVGTCAMGIGDAAVVDPELRVRGVAGLRVVDASVMPTVTSGNTNGPTIMIAAKAADLIRS
jgi:choline dehydrogenase